MKKKILILLMCVVFMCVLPIAVSAEDEIPPTESTSEIETEDIPTEAEIVTGVEITSTGAPAEEETSTESNIQIEAKIITEKIVKYVQAHLEEISVIFTMILTVFYQVRKHKALNKSMGIMNDNAIAVSENSSATIGQALSTMSGMAETVTTYKEEITKLLTEVRESAEEKKKLAIALSKVEDHLKVSKLANTELANEVAELLVLANIPNSKKDELYARHRAAVDAINAIADAEITEVKEDDGQEA